jgi:hypothetical protein
MVDLADLTENTLTKNAYKKRLDFAGTEEQDTMAILGLNRRPR